MIFVNFKTYEEGSGQKAVALTRVLEEVAHETQVKIIPVVQIIDAEMVVAGTRLEVWIQHIDPVSFGPYTGWTLPEEAVRIGIRGVFLNHSEHKFSDWGELAKATLRCREVDLKTLVFAGELEEFKQVLALEPTLAAYEPPELIGSTETSVAKAQPETIAKASVLAKEAGIPLIVGAGINSRDDVKKSLELGAVGVAVATDVVKAQDPRREILDLAEGFR
ncbi:MAG: Triosephosphate isomerase [Candidatus Woesebacteria bacterium GW2011_GWF2_46_8]|uniref:Triosephosphate isomerase n=1 Tax=Candidatus Woesebacteria bacterium GW2011_GWF2_46_8 TaxID=1618604 RepID=A0A0G1TNV2_9BACT|nr:MAG: Triosephosphate isomerase [Candidatus Woesebacteria bacterium GW2011_GWF2_46_8]